LSTEVVAGLVVAFALMPESISFAVVAGVDPLVGLLAAATMAVSISVLGGRPAMISGAAGSVALVVAPLSHQHGLPYLIAAIMLGGLLQVGLGLAGVATLMRFVPRGVLVGFVNALAILIFSAQLPNIEHVPWQVYPLVAAGLAVIVVFPRLTRVVPAPLVAIVVLTVAVTATHLSVPTVADKGAIGDWSLPSLALPDVPFTLHTLRTIAPYSLAMAVVGLLESLMTAQLVDRLTDTPSSKQRECWGQGLANIFTGLCGGMGGCAMIGQTIINIKTGGRTRLSTFSAGMSVFVLVGLLGSIVGRIPMAALVSVMILVAVSTFDWRSIRPSTLKRMPKSETAVMVTTVLATVASNDLAIGVVSGVVVATLLFARRVSHLIEITSQISADGKQRTYHVNGQLFFASSSKFAGLFDYAGDPDDVVIDLASSHVWDASSVAALDTVVSRYTGRGKRAEVINLNRQSDTLYRALSGRLDAD
jgi:sulfate permease, SulP family